MSTPYHAQYWAYALTLRGATDTVDNLSRAISNARVDLNPHQVDAALFAVRSPLSKGVILADEVGLGKTIEAALVIAQRWAERRRRILIVVPASLRRQWAQELEEKFFLPALVLDTVSEKRLRAEKILNPFFLTDRIAICSYHYAAARQDLVKEVPWDLVVIDEAHRLRNVYKPGAKTARALVSALEGRQKILLTATPLQNSLMELYGLVSVVDPHVFGDPTSFRDQFVRAPDEAARDRALRQRLAEVCRRTLRRQVLEHVRFTRRIPITQEFRPTDHEQALYDRVSEYLRRPTLLALPNSQRTLMTMVLRKLLASSSFAIGATLSALIGRLRNVEADLAATVARDFEGLDELVDELDGEEEEEENRIDPALLAEELGELSEAL
ncbi:MAG TPA: DEAD/DEAH box helicase, partial [Myxococcota bacterium]|nr:DEAD/DEAH box helicase [Myxococcota bacterium]